MKVKAIRGFCVGGGRDVLVGEVFEAGEWQAREWLAIGHVVEVTNEVEALDPAPAGDAHPEVNTGEAVKVTPKSTNRERGRGR